MDTSSPSTSGPANVINTALSPSPSNIDRPRNVRQRTRILFWNIAGLTNLTDLNDICSYDILCLTETWAKSPAIPARLIRLGMEPVTSAASRDHPRGRFKGGILCLLNKKVYNVINVFGDKDFIVLVINNISSIIITVYISPSVNIANVLNKIENYLSTINEVWCDYNVFIGGDFNARVGEKNQLFDEIILEGSCLYDARDSNDKTLNTRGKQLIESMENNGFILVNGRSEHDKPAMYTHLSSIGNTVIDLCWANLCGVRVIREFEILQMITFSDHFPICLTVEVLYEKEEERSVNKIDCNLKKLIWKECFRDEYIMYMQLSSEVGSTDLCVNGTYVKITEAIQEFAVSHGLVKRMLTGTVTRKNKPWFDEECGSIKREVKKLLNGCKKDNFAVFAENKKYTDLKKEYISLYWKGKKWNLKSYKFLFLLMQGNRMNFGG